MTQSPPIPFQFALAWILSAEGGLVSHASDKGGTTNYGISISYLRNLPLALGDLNHDGTIDAKDIRELTLEQAATIYARDFWAPAKCDSLPLYAAVCHFDGCVLMGQPNAVRTLQRAVGTEADGIIGPRTLAAAAALGFDEFLARYMSRRTRYLADIVDRDPTQAVFELGWYARLTRLTVAVVRATR